MNIQNDILEIVFYLIVIGIGVGYEYHRMHKVKASSHKLNTLLGAPFRPRHTRQLTEDEIRLLKQLTFTSIRPRTWITLSVYFTIFAFLFLKSEVVLIIIFAILLGGTIFALLIKEHRDDIYADTISPVLQLIGTITFPLNMKPELSLNYRSQGVIRFYVGDEAFQVRGSVDDLKNKDSFAYKLNTFEHDELVEVEYTSHTRTVLSVSKFNGD